MPFDNVVRVYSPRMELLAIFDGNSDALSVEDKRNVMVSPTVRRETNGESTLKFQMIANCEKWDIIKDPENIYELNDRYYVALNEGAYEYSGEGTARIVNVSLVETWYLLDKKYVQAYNCALYVYARAKFSRFVPDGAVFTISASGCSNPGDSISPALAWSQVKNWETQDEDGNYVTYGVLKSEGYEPKNWENAPAAVILKSIAFSGNTATVTIGARAKGQTTKTFAYTNDDGSVNTTFQIDGQPYPQSIQKVWVNTTTQQNVSEDGTDFIRYTTTTKEVAYTYNAQTGIVTLTYRPGASEMINSVIIGYEYSDLGDLQTGAECTLVYGAEVVDEHTFAILPKSDKKYKLTVNGVEYEDSQVRDARGAVMPRGSGGYALWAALRDTGWSLGICDVKAKGFDASIDYGCFNLETDMKDVLYIVQYIQELYGGILDFDSKRKVVNYRAENSVDYEAYNDGFNDWTGYEFREGKNLTDTPHITYDNEIITKAYLLGYNNLNVKEVNGGRSYITDHSYTDAEYVGYLEQSLIYDTRDQGGMKQLLYWGKRELAKKCRPRMSIEAEATDIRMVEGYEHEVFDLNNVVRLYYREGANKDEIFVEKRIIAWEYNAFAMYECSIELGDKTQNLSEVFRLIYNKAIEQTPNANASGRLSGGDIVIDVPEWGDVQFDVAVSGSGGGYGYGGGGVSSLASFNDYLELIVRKTTQNTDAIAGLIIEADELHASTEQFSYFQKTTAQMVSETYAGLKTYADGEIASLALTAKGWYDSVQRYAESGFEAQATQNESFSRQFANFSTELGETNASITAKADALHAEIVQEAKYREDGITESSTSIRQWASKQFARIDIESTVGSLTSRIVVDSTYTHMYSSAGAGSAVVSVQPQGITLSTGGSIYIGNVNTSLSIKNTVCSWKSASVVTSVTLTHNAETGGYSISTSRTSINYLGY